MNILEKELEDVIWSSINNDEIDLSDHGLWFESQNWIRQFNLGEYGIADIIGYTIENDSISWEIIELKKDKIGVGTLLQSIGYYKALSRISKDFKNESYKIILIGKEIEPKGEFVFIADFIDNLEFYTYNIDLINGINFKQHYGFCLNDERSFLLAKEKFLKEIKLPTPKTETDGEPNT